MVDVNKNQLRTNGFYTSSESDENGKSDFDDEYFRLRPPLDSHDYSNRKIVTIKPDQFAVDENNKLEINPILTYSKSDVRLAHDRFNNHIQKNVVGKSNFLVFINTDPTSDLQKKKRTRTRKKKNKSISNMDKIIPIVKNHSSSNIVISTTVPEKKQKSSSIKNKSSSNLDKIPTIKNNVSSSNIVISTTVLQKKKRTRTRESKSKNIVDKNPIINNESGSNIVASTTLPQKKKKPRQTKPKSQNNMDTIPTIKNNVSSSNIVISKTVPQKKKRTRTRKNKSKNNVDKIPTIDNESSSNIIISTTVPQKKQRSRLKKYKSQSKIDKISSVNIESSSNSVISTTLPQKKRIPRFTKNKSQNNIDNNPSENNEFSSNTPHFNRGKLYQYSADDLRKIGNSLKASDYFIAGYTSNSLHAISKKNKIVNNKNKIKSTRKSAEEAHTSNDPFENNFNASSSDSCSRDGPKCMVNNINKNKTKSPKPSRLYRDGYFYNMIMEDDFIEMEPLYNMNTGERLEYEYGYFIDEELSYTYGYPVPGRDLTGKPKNRHQINSSHTIKFKNVIVQAIFEVIIFQLNPIETIFQELAQNFF